MVNQTERGKWIPLGLAPFFCWLPGSFFQLLVVIATFLPLCPLIASAATQVKIEEFIRDGNFELGITDLDINRFPRYPKNNGMHISSPRRTNINPIQGQYSLLLPGLKEGSYLLIYRTLPLVPMKTYAFSATVRVSAATEIELQVFAPNWKVAKKQSYSFVSGEHHISITLQAANGPLINSDEVAHKLRIAVSGQKDILLDEISLRGESGVSGPVLQPNVTLEPDRNFAVYALNEVGTFSAHLKIPTDKKYFYEIYDPIQQKVIGRNALIDANNKIGPLKKDIPLITSRRGFFWVRILSADVNNKPGEIATYPYVVINPDPGPPEGREFFGLCIEEHGQQTHSNARVGTEDLYRIAHQIGAGSVRIFALAMPDIVSPGGRTFDFTEADKSLLLLKKYDLQPFIVLGSNNFDRIPAWMRIASETSNTIDLQKKNNAPLNGTANNQHFLSLATYQNYLEQVFIHFKNRVKYYELWNEPGYKFTVPEILTIAQLTRKVQAKVDPSARILGYSSTISEAKKGRDPLDLPGFIDQVAKNGGLNNIDVLSYHSGHAFEYVGGYDYDKRNLETGFVNRLRKILAREGKSDMSIWDSEMGISWVSPNSDRIDSQEGTEISKSKYHRSDVHNVLDVARQLPMVYAAAAANGVERLFWFTLDDTIYDISNTKRKWDMVDGQMAPMPQIAAYDAMTEILGGAKFSRLIDRPDGTRAYLFKKASDTLVLGYNWKEQRSKITLNQPIDRVKMLDVMGNTLVLPKDRVVNNIYEMNAWPKYILISNIEPEKVNLR